MNLDKFKDLLLSIDPVSWAEKNLTLDGKPFKLIGNGYKPFCDIYRYIGITALSPKAKPVVLVKGRQVGATTMASVLELFFMGCDLFGTNGRAPMRIIHAFPTLDIAYTYTKTKLNPMISSAKPNLDSKGKPKSVMEAKIDKTASANDSLAFKAFEFGNHIQIESTGLDANRLRGRTVDAALFDECFPGNQYIEVEGGKKTIRSLYESWKNGKELPRVKTFNEETEEFEYKKIIKAWKRNERNLIQLTLGNREIRCTPEHRFLTTTGWVAAKDLTIGSLIRMAPSTKLKVRELNDDQYQIMLGSFLGDGTIPSFKQNRYRIRWTHGIDQAEYCRWKLEMFQQNNFKYIKENGYSKKPAIAGSTKIFGLSNIVPSEKTYCPQWVLDDLDERGLAIWFMDDGSKKNNCSFSFSTCSFDEESHKRIIQKLNSFGINAHYTYYKHEGRKQEGYFYTFVSKNSFEYLSKLVAPFIHPNLSYKLFNQDDEKVGTYDWNNHFKKTSLTVVDKIKYLDKKEIVYDLEVEDNHNFIVTTVHSSPNLGGPIAHNCQDMTRQALVNTEQILAKAQYGQRGSGIRVYFGTPKQKGTVYWDIWNASTQQYYYLGCEQCNEYFPLYTPQSDEWETIWIEDNLPEDHPSHGFIVKCTHCGHEQDKRDAAERGKWVSSKSSEENDECEFIGYHINQLYMPEIPREKIIAKKPENSEVYTERAYQNEVLGEFFAGDASPITLEELQTLCSDPKRPFRSSIAMSENKLVYLGADWGERIDIGAVAVEGSERKTRGQSYSCVVIISIEGAGIINIEFAQKLKSNDLEYKKQIIEECFRRYSVIRGVGDIGYARDLSEILHREHGDRFLVSRSSGNVTNHYKFIDDIYPQEIIFDKDYLISEVFQLFKAGKIRFPAKSYEQVAWLMQHCASMEIKPYIDRGGNVKIKYVKGSTPSDGFFSLLNAILAWKYDISGGFSINHPDKMKTPTKKSPVLATLGYMPRR